MQDRAQKLLDSINSTIEKLRLKPLEAELEVLKQASQDGDFWADNLAAGATMKRIGKLESQLGPWQDLTKAVSEQLELIGLGDPGLTHEIGQGLGYLEQQYSDLKGQLKFTGPYDDHDALVSLYAGAGGTDAQDWAAMLLRMYSRWASKNGYKVDLVDQSSGDEAGIKSATLTIEGPFAYGKLKGEHGVHRLVRLSPFNSDNLRQTSFAKVDIIPKIDGPGELDIDPKELTVEVYRAGGHGGQSVNTTDSAVRITHIPTGVTVAIQNERSQLQNKETAMTILRSRLAQLQTEQHAQKLSELKGPNQAVEWGSQIRSYVLHPYNLVKDARTKHETSDTSGVLDGDINGFLDSALEL